MHQDHELKLMVGHKRPEFDLWSGHRFATLNPIVPNDFKLSEDLELKELLPDSLIGEYYFLFLIRRQIEKNTSLKSITLSQYRRFVTTQSIGQPSTNQPYANLISKIQVANLNLGSLIVAKKEGWLVSSFYSTPPSVSYQYSRSHILRDWFRFLADSFDAGLLNATEITESACTNILIPAPSNGVFPVLYFVEHLIKLEACARIFVISGYKPRDAYQRRVIGFCLERLHSYLLLASLSKLKINFKEAAGQQVVISENDSVKPTI
jgi:hypothetical protein